MNSEYVYRFIFENVQDGVLLHDAKTLEVIDVNTRFCELYHVSKDEIPALRPGSTGRRGPQSGSAGADRNHFQLPGGICHQQE